MRKGAVRMLYNLADLSCSFGSSIMQKAGRPALDEYLEPNGDYEKNIVWLKMVQRCQMFVTDRAAFIYILGCLLCCYLTNIFRHDYVVCSKKSAMYVWKIKLPWANENAILLPTLSRNLFVAHGNNYAQVPDYMFWCGELMVEFTHHFCVISLALLQPCHSLPTNEATGKLWERQSDESTKW